MGAGFRPINDAYAVPGARMAYGQGTPGYGGDDAVMKAYADYLGLGDLQTRLPGHAPWIMANAAEQGGKLTYNQFAGLYGALGGGGGAKAPIAAPGVARTSNTPVQAPAAFMPTLPTPTNAAAMQATQRVAPAVQGLLDPAQLYLPQGRG